MRKSLKFIAEILTLNCQGCQLESNNSDIFRELETAKIEFSHGKIYIMLL